jgi:class 3 adenylate cyclase/predicted ATPase
MQCPQCQHTNNETAKFCEECGTRLVWMCPGCGQEVSPRASFCSECGASLTRRETEDRRNGELEEVSPKPKVRNRESERNLARDVSAVGERRQLTVQFIDLVGSTTLSTQLDPEDYHTRVVAYQAACRQVIARYEGHIAQYLGDGVLVYFGYPAAHEEDAVRAVRSGLDIVTAVGQVEFTPPLQVRIGIHTGPVVVAEVGAGARTEQLALGETPNIAARVQGEAAPNTVVISQATYRLVQGLFECHELGPQVLKGLSTSMALYRVERKGTAQSRFEVVVKTGLTPLVGREEEIGLLRKRWEWVREGEGQVVLLSGEAGIGKSRLVQELKERVAREGHTRIEFHCYPYYRNTALYPVIEHLQRVLRFQRDDMPQVKLQKLEQTLASYQFAQADTIPLLAALLSLPHPEGYPPLTMSPQRQKQKTYEALIGWILEDAEKAGVYCACEDLHWADPSTLELLSLFIEQVPTTRILALLTFRPEFTPPWGTHAHLSSISLGRLGRTQVGEMVERLTGGKALPAEVIQQVVRKTDGIPLFVEELTKMVLESGLLRETNGRYELTGSLPPLAIPATLQDSLMARLDRLAPVREVAQLGATLGREFSYELIQAVSAFDEEALQQGLTQLVEAELLYQRGLPPQAQYIFKHALVQDTAYQSLLRSKRQQYHKKIAQVLEERFPEMREVHPELVAYHYTEAGLREAAIPYWHRAGQNAIQRSANVEAISHLTRGIELLMALPDTAERAQRELNLQVTLGPALMATKGYGAEEVKKTFARARELCQRLGETPQLFTVLRGLWGFYIVRAELQTALDLGEQLLRLAQSVQDPLLLLEAHYGLGATSFYRGEFVRAREHSEQGMVFFDPQKRRAQRALQDSGVACLSYAAWALWHLGYPDQALKRSAEALTLAQKLSHPISLAWALCFAAMLHQHRHEGQAAQEWAGAAIRICSEQGFAFWLANSTVIWGWALAEQGQLEEGIAQMHQGLTAWQATGAELARPYFHVLLAEAYGKVGRAQEGLALLAEALLLVEKNKDRFYEAELYRLKGQLTLQSQTSPRQVPDKSQTSHGPVESKSEVTNPQSLIPNPQAEAEACFLKAIEIARRQQAKSWELRIVMGLARLWQQQGKGKQARHMLAELYNWFTEGFDTVDLREARALLDKLT